MKRSHDDGDATALLEEDPANTQCSLCHEGPREQDVLLRDPSRRPSLAGHLNCLLFSSGLSQRGEDNEGLKGTEDQTLNADDMEGV